jgi:hypothetical protein
MIVKPIPYADHLTLAHTVVEDALDSEYVIVDRQGQYVYGTLGTPAVDQVQVRLPHDPMDTVNYDQAVECVALFFDRQPSTVGYFHAEQVGDRLLVTSHRPTAPHPAPAKTHSTERITR